MKILMGKVALYKKGYHVLRRRLKTLTCKKKKLEIEVKQLKRVVQMHEDISSLF